MAGYALTPYARTGLRSILEYVEREFGARVGERVLDKLVAAFELIADNPGIGHRREDLTTDEWIRFWAAGPTLIAYRTTTDTIEILFIERGEKDWARLLESDF